MASPLNGTRQSAVRDSMCRVVWRSSSMKGMSAAMLQDAMSGTRHSVCRAVVLSRPLQWRSVSIFKHAGGIYRSGHLSVRVNEHISLAYYPCGLSQMLSGLGATIFYVRACCAHGYFTLAVCWFQARGGLRQLRNLQVHCVLERLL